MAATTKEYVLEGRTTFSSLQTIRGVAPNVIPAVLASGPDLEYENHEALGAVGDHEDIQRAFPCTYGRARISLKPAAGGAGSVPRKPLRVGVVLSGGQVTMAFFYTNTMHLHANIKNMQTQTLTNTHT